MRLLSSCFLSRENLAPSHLLLPQAAIATISWMVALCESAILPASHFLGSASSPFLESGSNSTAHIPSPPSIFNYPLLPCLPMKAAATNSRSHQSCLLRSEVKNWRGGLVTITMKEGEAKRSHETKSRELGRRRCDCIHYFRVTVDSVILHFVFSSRMGQSARK